METAKNQLNPSYGMRDPIDGGGVEYTRLLRVIGQELEGKGVTTCCLWVEADGFEVIGLCPADIDANPEERRFWQRFITKSSSPGHATIELRYGVQDLLRLEEFYEVKRNIGPARSDFLTLSEQLRTVGAIVDRRAGQLVRLDRIAYENMISSFAVQYKTRAGELVTEEFSAASLYDFSVQMFMMEKRRTNVRPSVHRAA